MCLHFAIPGPKAAEIARQFEEALVRRPTWLPGGSLGRGFFEFVFPLQSAGVGSFFNRPLRPPPKVNDRVLGLRTLSGHVTLMQCHGWGVHRQPGHRSTRSES